MPHHRCRRLRFPPPQPAGLSEAVEGVEMSHMKETTPPAVKPVASTFGQGLRSRDRLSRPTPSSPTQSKIFSRAQ